MTPKTLAGLPEMEKRRETRPALKKRRFLKGGKPEITTGTDRN